MIEELEGQVSIHRLDPEGEAGKLNGKRIDVDAVEAALDDVTLQARDEARLELVVVGTAREELIGQPPVGRGASECHSGAIGVGKDPVVSMKAFEKGSRQETKGSDQKRA